MKYRPEIDGLRAIAVIGVILFHAGLIEGGFVGVDVFFVISGYLITSIIDRKLLQGSFSFQDFWFRRCRRILPALFCCVFATLFAGWFVLLPNDFYELGQATIAQGVGLANFYYFRESGYFAGPAELKPLLHTWSLAVEEQFYVLMPLIFYGVFCVNSKSRYVFLAILGILSFLCSALMSGSAPDACFYLLPARAWELILGAVLASGLFDLSSRRSIQGIAGTLGVVLIVASMTALSTETVFPGIAAALPCCGAALVVVGATESNLTGKMLALKPVVFVGKISYSLYLWHWPGIAYIHYMGVGIDTTIPILGWVGLSFVLAICSWKFVEEPFRHGGRNTSMIRTFATAFAVNSIIIVIGAAIFYWNGVPGRFSPDVVRVAGYEGNSNPFRKIHHDLPHSKLVREGLPVLGDFKRGKSSNVLLLGDSHGSAYAPAFNAVLTDIGYYGYCTTRSATLPLFWDTAQENSKEFEYLSTVQELVDSQKTIRDVILAARWHHYKSDELRLSRIRATLDWFKSRGINTWVLAQVPEPRANIPRSLALEMAWGWKRRNLGESVVSYSKDSDAIRDLFVSAGLKKDCFVPVRGFFYSEENSVSQTEKDSLPLYFDDDHLSAFGALQLAPVFRNVILSIFEQNHEHVEISHILR